MDHYFRLSLQLNGNICLQSGRHSIMPPDGCYIFCTNGFCFSDQDLFLYRQKPLWKFQHFQKNHFEKTLILRLGIWMVQSRVGLSAGSAALISYQKKWSEFQANRIWSSFACQRSILVFQNLNIVHKSDKIFQKQRGMIEFFGLSTGLPKFQIFTQMRFFLCGIWDGDQGTWKLYRSLRFIAFRFGLKRSVFPTLIR